MNANIDWLDDFPPQQRLALFLDAELAGEDRDEQIRRLATELGYKNAKTVEMWTTCASKVPLHMLTRIAHNTGGDVSNLLPLWIAQEMAGEDADQLYNASKRMLSLFEFSVIAVARDVYRGDDDEREDG